jgi:hypothetical protein
MGKVLIAGVEVSEPRTKTLEVVVQKEVRYQVLTITEDVLSQIVKQWIVQHTAFRDASEIEVEFSIDWRDEAFNGVRAEIRENDV